MRKKPEVGGGDQKGRKLKAIVKREEEHSAIKELPTANSKLQTEKMEVHHHPQLEHKPKPWKEYLLEGFMIFIAVMMGFFAENLREHISDIIAKRNLPKRCIPSCVMIR